MLEQRQVRGTYRWRMDRFGVGFEGRRILPSLIRPQRVWRYALFPIVLCPGGRAAGARCSSAAQRLSAFRRSHRLARRGSFLLDEETGRGALVGGLLGGSRLGCGRGTMVVVEPACGRAGVCP